MILPSLSTGGIFFLHNQRTLFLRLFWFPLRALVFLKAQFFFSITFSQLFQFAAMIVSLFSLSVVWAKTVCLQFCDWSQLICTAVMASAFHLDVSSLEASCVSSPYVIQSVRVQCQVRPYLSSLFPNRLIAIIDDAGLLRVLGPSTIGSFDL